jgi:hypothetical protein
MKIKVELHSSDPVLIDAVGAKAREHVGKIEDLSVTGDGGMELLYDFRNSEMALAFKQSVIVLPGVSSADGQEADASQPQRLQVLPTPGRKMTKNRKKNTLWRIDPQNDGQGGP